MNEELSPIIDVQSIKIQKSKQSNDSEIFE
jgi:hypothetical protein